MGKTDPKSAVPKGDAPPPKPDTARQSETKPAPVITDYASL